MKFTVRTKRQALHTCRHKGQKVGCQSMQATVDDIHPALPITRNITIFPRTLNPKPKTQTQSPKRVRVLIVMQDLYHQPWFHGIGHRGVSELGMVV